MSDSFRFTDDDTDLDAASLNKLIDSGTQNLLENGSFENWDVAGTCPRGWQETGGGTVAKETNINYLKHGNAAVKCSMASGGVHAVFRYVVAASANKAIGLTYVKGQTFTLSGWVMSNLANKGIQLYLHDGVGGLVYSDALTAGGTWTYLSVTMEASSSSTYLIAGVSFPDDTYTGYADALMLVEGEVARPYAFNFRDLTGTDESTASNWDAELRHAMVYSPYGATIVSQSGLSDSGSWTAVDIPATASTWSCEDNAVAVLLKVEAWDSGVQGSNPSVKFREKNDSDADNEQYVPCGENGSHIWSQIWVGLDTGGEFEWWADASGSGTLSFKVWPLGYLRPV